jgi:hypothetical protein
MSETFTAKHPTITATRIASIEIVATAVLGDGSRFVVSSNAQVGDYIEETTGDLVTASFLDMFYTVPAKESAA